MIISSGAFVSDNGRLRGENVAGSVRRLKDLPGLFMDDTAYRSMDPEQIVYEVQLHNSCGSAEGGLLFGTSTVTPGKVGREYFMTKGHFHEIRNRAEYYWGISGKGVLVTMDERRQASTVRIEPGSLHYIPGHAAHRIVNIGDCPLVVGACWLADAGYDYDLLAKEGFSVRIVEENGAPAIWSNK
ncbi:glucose-6-phosphate isomerase family protein [Cohnella terricola]|uniref:glucose-6-phosphate isomerase n=1 Tax=Cohnella terricola TaxID=1289167 RepID=A0A559JT30_9BACL|nr:glucose-6-phosphate isomerase family protein [Cohnella terricola]TVY03039.1 cupin domain-containing protein [Cohnella terricola]